MSPLPKTLEVLAEGASAVFADPSWQPGGEKFNQCVPMILRDMRVNDPQLLISQDLDRACAILMDAVTEADGRPAALAWHASTAKWAYSQSFIDMFLPFYRPPMWRAVVVQVCIHHAENCAAQEVFKHGYQDDPLLPKPVLDEAFNLVRNYAITSGGDLDEAERDAMRRDVVAKALQVMEEAAELPKKHDVKEEAAEEDEEGEEEEEEEEEEEASGSAGRRVRRRPSAATSTQLRGVKRAGGNIDID